MEKKDNAWTALGVRTIIVVIVIPMENQTGVIFH